MSCNIIYLFFKLLYNREDTSSTTHFQHLRRRQLPTMYSQTALRGAHAFHTSHNMQPAAFADYSPLPKEISLAIRHRHY